MTSDSVEYEVIKLKRQAEESILALESVKKRYVLTHTPHCPVCGHYMSLRTMPDYQQFHWFCPRDNIQGLNVSILVQTEPFIEEAEKIFFDFQKETQVVNTSKTKQEQLSLL